MFRRRKVALRNTQDETGVRNLPARLTETGRVGSRIGDGKRRCSRSPALVQILF